MHFSLTRSFFLSLTRSLARACALSLSHSNFNRNSILHRHRREPHARAVEGEVRVGPYVLPYKGTSLIEKRPILRFYSSPVPRAQGWSQGAGVFL
jgi:hypothetical protein